MLKKAGIVIYVIVSVVIVVCLLWGALALISALYFDNSDLKPGKDYVTEYVSPTSPYAVEVLYDENHHPIDIIIVKAKSGVSVAGVGQDAFSYEIKETTSTMTIVLYDNEGVVSGTYEFDTKKGEWVTSQISSVENNLNGFEYRNNNYNFSLSFPKSWGNISEKITSGPKERKIFKTVKLTSEKDPKRYVNITLVDVKFREDPLVAADPMEFVTKNSDFAFYFSGAGDQVAEIIKTFKLF